MLWTHCAFPNQFPSEIDFRCQPDWMNMIYFPKGLATAYNKNIEWDSSCVVF